jgi:hypothetical protein
MMPFLWLGCEGAQQNKIAHSINRITQNLKSLANLRVKVFLLTSLIFFGFTLAAAPAVQAQSPEYSEIDARIQILTRPIGALVLLNGEYSTAGRTPYTISYFLKGRYRIRAIKPGYENWETDYVFNGQGDDKLSIKLTPKKRYKAVLRSALLPGLGQAYSDHKTRGIIIGLMQFSAVGVSLYQHVQYNEALNDYNAALKDFQASQKTQNGQDDLIAQVQASKADLDEAYAIRKKWLMITGLIYVYNLLDAMLFFPSYHNDAWDVGVSLNQNPALHGAAVELNVKTKF